MAALSYSIAWGGAESDFVAGAQSVTVGAQAPSAGDLEVRFSSSSIGANGQGITALAAKQLFDVIFRFIESNSAAASDPSQWPNL